MITRPCHFCGKEGSARGMVYSNDVTEWSCGMWEHSEEGACGKTFYSYGSGMLTKTFATFREVTNYRP